MAWVTFNNPNNEPNSAHKPRFSLHQDNVMQLFDRQLLKS